ncbi:MAG: hypothetical protein Q4F97_06225 [Bacteroidales bacterium]|nr:hypothetical protein [Bacteroidales bacterium]
MKNIFVLIFAFLALPIYSDSIPINSNKIIDYFKELNSVSQEKVYIHTDKPNYAAGENIFFKIYVVNSTTHNSHEVGSNYVMIELVNSKKECVMSKKVKRTDSIFCGNLSLDPSIEPGEYLLRGYTNWMLNFDTDFIFNKKIYIGNSLDETVKENNPKQVNSKDFSVTFFPEGGDLIETKMQNVAFKAQGEDGYSVNVHGYLLDEKDDTITSNIASVHDGMGSFPVFDAKQGKKIYAVFADETGNEKSFKLPDVKTSGSVIQILQARNEIIYKIDHTQDVLPTDSFYVVAHIRGYITYLLPIDGKFEGTRVPKDIFPSGIIHFLLLNNKGMTVSERIIYNRPPYYPEIKVNGEPKLAKREKEEFMIAVVDTFENKYSGDFSISVTDAALVKNDTISDDIVSNLFLTSDIKGYVENPRYYFSGDNPKINQALNLLMMTHGWRRHVINNVFEPYPKNKKYDFFVENGLGFSGKVSGAFGSNKKVPISVATNIGKVGIVETDEKGFFTVSGIEYPDSTLFFLQSAAKTRLNINSIEVFSPEPPKFINKYPVSRAENLKMSDEYLNMAKNMYYEEGGMKVINLKGVVVKAQYRPKPSDPNYRYTNFSDHEITQDRIDKMGGFQTAFTIARTLPGIMMGEQDGFKVLKVARSNTMPYVVIDDAVYEDANIYMELENMPASSVQRIDYVGPERNFFMKSNGAIIVTLRPLAERPVNKPYTKLYKPRGYDTSVQFYNPVYETPEQKKQNKNDYRTTIYWNPALRVDSLGMDSLNFYMNDVTTKMRVIIEGITDEGIPLHFEKVFGEEKKD